jgi:hypothetical protein
MYLPQSEILVNQISTSQGLPYAIYMWHHDHQVVSNEDFHVVIDFEGRRVDHVDHDQLSEVLHNVVGAVLLARSDHLFPLTFHAFHLLVCITMQSPSASTAVLVKYFPIILPMSIYIYITDCRRRSYQTLELCHYNFEYIDAPYGTDLAGGLMDISCYSSIQRGKVEKKKIVPF